MLYITLKEGDYFMIGGNVKVTFERTAGRDAMYVGVDAPREVPVMRGKLYEDYIAKQAENGDERAEQLRQELLKDYEKRARTYSARRSSRAEYDRRIQSGEIKTPQDWGPENDETRARHLARVERDKKALAGGTQK